MGDAKSTDLFIEQLNNYSYYGLLNSTNEYDLQEAATPLETSIGLLLAVLSNVFNGFSIVIRRRGLQNSAVSSFVACQI
jgi:hypothetical protein